MLSQTMRPDAVILWLAEGDQVTLPRSILAMKQLGLEIRTCPDYRSYKKIIPALTGFPDAYIATADDDIYYRPNWLRELVEAHHTGEPEVVCHRAHLIVLDERGLPLPYDDWHLSTQETGPSSLLFPTSGAGALYPPGTFDSQVVDADMFLSLAPTADDLWLFWMAARNGATFRRVKRARRLSVWPGSQEVSLWLQNSDALNGNDRQIAHLLSAFGFPLGGTHKEHMGRAI
ncbi:hypothetical protein [Devosia sp.]|uniref:hypothetical protein n=1 Tax=Devosia sp. TaxID=1871048 RepID=UPI002609F16E|nr:hypothetical protein [Devosia sp.]